MKKIKLSQLTEKLLLGVNEALCVEHEGKMLGYFYPVLHEQAEVDAAYQRLQNAVEQVTKETGLDEEGLVQALTSKNSDLEQ
ncbi:MAG: hypothetical protein SAJ37_13340 [Oscillatoria sp. PMC 1068.18]|nr:hypothetical protein [Oscillatoria sp. PMC 1076.18]MEC4989708.1 hypothetical protein [Oscillatoria sp. PMC 1068.18]